MNCVDRHIKTARRNKAALIWEGEPGDRRTLTYWDLYVEVQKFANVLKKLGVKRGDRVAIYMPLIPEVAIAMLACTRIGAAHSVVFGGFSPDSLRDRINDAKCKVLVTADGGYRRGGVVPLKRNSDKAIEECPSIEHVVVVQRRPGAAGDEAFADMKEGRDHWWHRLMHDASPDCEPEKMDAEDVLYILYTSGTTGKPKGIVHTTGGYLTAVAATTKLVFDLKDDDVFWCTADVGWVTGHSYLVYGPLANGATCMMYEGAPDWPEKDRFWSICERPRRDDSLYRADCDSRVHEVGRPMARQARSVAPSTARIRRRADQSRSVDVVSGQDRRQALPDRRHVVANGNGRDRNHAAAWCHRNKTRKRDDAVPRIRGDAARRARQTRSKLAAVCWPSPNRIRRCSARSGATTSATCRRTSRNGRTDRISTFPGDGAKRDDDGYFWILGRVDDVLNVAGHRIGTMEVESALVEHPAVAEAAVVGRTHELKGQALAAFVTLREGFTHEQRAWSRSCATSSLKKSARSPSRTTFSSRPTCQRHARARSCGACCATSPKVARSATRRRLPTPTSVAALKEQYEAQES